MEIITKLEQEQLSIQARLKDLYTNNYLVDDDNENLQLIADLFFNKDIERAKKFNIGTNLFTTITDVFSYFVGNPMTDIELETVKNIKDLISVGQMAIGINRINGELKPIYIPGESVIISNNEVKVVNLYKAIVDDEIKYYLLRQLYSIGKVENNLFELDKISDIEGIEVPLDTIQQTAHLEPIINTGLDRISIFTLSVRNELDYAQSELDKIKNLVYSLERKAVMFETQFLQETEQYKIFENISIPDKAIKDDGTVDLIKMGKVLATNSDLGDKGNIKYISNKNDLITDAISYEEAQIKKISAATLIPVDFLGINSTGVISEGSRSIMQGAFQKKVRNYRNMIEGLIREMTDIFGVKDLIVWEDIFARDMKSLADELKVAKEIGAVSQFTIVKKYNQFNTDKEVKDELKQIEDEKPEPILQTNNIDNGSTNNAIQDTKETQNNNTTEIKK